LREPGVRIYRRWCRRDSLCTCDDLLRSRISFGVPAELLVACCHLRLASQQDGSNEVSAAATQYRESPGVAPRFLVRRTGVNTRQSTQWTTDRCPELGCLPVRALADKHAPRSSVCLFRARTLRSQCRVCEDLRLLCLCARRLCRRRRAATQTTK